ncbi:MAG TPA: hypothetical protein VMV05_04865 [bacterium]|nr:hypothetical protein [bacterium]
MHQPTLKNETSLKRMIFLMPVLFLVSALAVPAAEKGDSGKDKAAPASGDEATQPVVINLARGSSGGHNRNFPSQSPRSNSPAPTYHNPSYGRFQWNAPSRSWAQPEPWTPSQPSRRGTGGGLSKPNPNTHFNPNFRTYSRPNAQAYTSPGLNAAVAVHHHAYTPGYVRMRLRNIGVASEPKIITNRSEIIHTDRRHSVISYPKRGPDGGALRATALSPRFFNGPVVRQTMARLGGADWRERVHQADFRENRANHYYWHRDHGFDYCHYLDGWGYHWWGWYVGDFFFWTRYYEGRWWWYDTGYDRWCFWNDGFWWWQDPYHMGDLYCYDNEAYIPANSANDQVVVTSPYNPNLREYYSPDRTRKIEVVGESQDAFLYDTAVPPAFSPVYLASGVQGVQFSDTRLGRPLEVILTLNDGSFDLFDGYGNAYNPEEPSPR